MSSPLEITVEPDCRFVSWHSFDEDGNVVSRTVAFGPRDGPAQLLVHMPRPRGHNAAGWERSREDVFRSRRRPYDFEAELDTDWRT